MQEIVDHQNALVLIIAGLALIASNWRLPAIVIISYSLVTLYDLSEFGAHIAGNIIAVDAVIFHYVMYLSIDVIALMMCWQWTNTRILTAFACVVAFYTMIDAAQLIAEFLWLGDSTVYYHSFFQKIKLICDIPILIAWTWHERKSGGIIYCITSAAFKRLLSVFSAKKSK